MTNIIQFKNGAMILRKVAVGPSPSYKCFSMRTNMEIDYKNKQPMLKFCNGKAGAQVYE